MSLKKTTAEQESRAFREKLETLSTNSSKDKQQIRTLEEALTKEEADHNSQVVKLKSEIGRLEELVDSVKLKAQMDVSGLDRSKGQVSLIDGYPFRIGIGRVLVLITISFKQRCV